MSKIKKIVMTAILSMVAALTLCFGVVLSVPTKAASAATLATANWTLAREGDNMFRVQNGNTYWSAYTNSVTTASLLDYTEINGKTLSEINAEKPGAVNVTLQPAGGSIGSFYGKRQTVSFAERNSFDISGAGPQNADNVDAGVYGYSGMGCKVK